MKSFTLVLMLLSLPPSFAAEKTTDAFCREKWTAGTSLNQRMFDHCLEEQTETRLLMETFQKEHASETWFKDVAQQGCLDRWTKDNFVQSEMVHFCFKQEWESYKSLKYQSTLPSYNSGRAEACFKVWKSNPGIAFGKTEECYRKQTEVPNFALPKALLLMLGSDSEKVAATFSESQTPKSKIEPGDSN